MSACVDCNEVQIASCEETLCDGAITMPCSEKISAECIIITEKLPNIGDCKSQAGDYECKDLQTILLAIDDLMENCNGGGGGDSFIDDDWHIFNDNTDDLYDAGNDIMVLGDVGAAQVYIDGTQYSLTAYGSGIRQGTSISADLVSLAFKRNHIGDVEFRGSVQCDFGFSIASGSYVAYTIGRLPDGYRPSTNQEMLIHSDKAQINATVKIDTNGVVAIYFRQAPVAAKLRFSFDGVVPYKPVSA